MSPADIDALFAPVSCEARLALAVSGGGDSMGLLYLAEIWSRRSGVALHALTVDHGLRPESAAEAAMVADFCAARGITHQTLQWQREEGAVGNLSDAAREGRYRAMAAACEGQGIDLLLTGHTLDDQAETVLMRLGRGSGVDGLAGMRAFTRLWSLCLFRPLLGLRREGLRQMLREAEIVWADDPTNENRAYARIQARDALATLAPLGITPERLAATASMMEDAQAVLEERATALEAQSCTVSPLGYIRIDPVALAEAPRETARRLVARMLCRVSGQLYRPRLSALDSLLARMLAPGFPGATLHGCRIDRGQGACIIQREPNACTMILTPARSGLWDQRFHLTLPTPLAEAPGLSIAATGEAGLRHLKALKHDSPPEWQTAPRPARMASPALWQGDKLRAVPLAEYAESPGFALRCGFVPSFGDRGMVDPDKEAFI